MSDKGTDAKLVESLRWYVETDDNPLKSEDMSDAADRLVQYHDEVTIVLGLLDGLTDQRGVERVAGISKDLQCLLDIGSTTAVASKCIMDQLATMRTCRDRLRELVNGPV